MLYAAIGTHIRIVRRQAGRPERVQPFHHFWLVDILAFHSLLLIEGTQRLLILDCISIRPELRKRASLETLKGAFSGHLSHSGKSQVSKKRNSTRTTDPCESKK
jgi:hypothetical protein